MDLILVLVLVLVLDKDKPQKANEVVGFQNRKE